MKMSKHLCIKLGFSPEVCLTLKCLIKPWNHGLWHLLHGSLERQRVPNITETLLRLPPPNSWSSFLDSDIRGPCNWKKRGTIVCLLRMSCPSDLVSLEKKKVNYIFESKPSLDILLEIRSPPLTGMVFLGLWHDCP